MMKGLLACLILLPMAVSAQSVSSPDGALRFELELDENGAPRYRVSHRGDLVIAPSGLGLDFGGVDSFTQATELSAGDVLEKNTQWELPWGERRAVTDHHHERSFFLSNDSLSVELQVRVFNDGLGFRYRVSSEQPGRIDIRDELTEFRIAREGRAFWQPSDGHESYEHLYRETSIDAAGPAHTPMTLVLDNGLHVSLHEAALTNYSAYTLEQVEPGTFLTRLRPWGGLDSEGRDDRVAVRTRYPFTTPWRTIQITESASGLLNSSLILNLNEPNALGDVSWVEPGKYAGIWWEIHLGQGDWATGPNHAATTEAVKAKIDFASANGFAGVLAEGWNVGWNADYVANPTQDHLSPAPGFDLKAVTDYAARKNVRLVGHHETGGHATHYETQMASSFEMLAAHGVRQVKTGYVGQTGTLKRVDADGRQHLEHKDGQFAVGHHLRNIRAAARHRISINTHEPVKDTGLRRTYPNWITREGSRGQEFNIWGNPGNPPEHEVMLAYTRLLAGPMDFTPGIFDLDFNARGNERRISTTLAKQLALYVTIYSPIQMVPDLRENYEAYPDEFRFIVDVPTDWEQSVALAGEVGDYVVMARQERGGPDWYLGAITNEDGRTLSVPLSFLGDGDYTATIYRDGANAHWERNPYATAIETRTLSKEDILELTLAPGGGAAIRFESKG